MIEYSELYSIALDRLLQPVELSSSPSGLPNVCVAVAKIIEGDKCSESWFSSQGEVTFNACTATPHLRDWVIREDFFFREGIAKEHEEEAPSQRRSEAVE